MCRVAIGAPPGNWFLQSQANDSTKEEQKNDEPPNDNPVLDSMLYNELGDDGSTLRPVILWVMEKLTPKSINRIMWIATFITGVYFGIKIGSAIWS